MGIKLFAVCTFLPAEIPLKLDFHDLPFILKCCSSISLLLLYQKNKETSGDILFLKHFVKLTVGGRRYVQLYLQCEGLCTDQVQLAKELYISYQSLFLLLFLQSSVELPVRDKKPKALDCFLMRDYVPRSAQNAFTHILIRLSQ